MSANFNSKNVMLVGLKGEKGDKGDTGAQGPKGDPGKDGVTVTIASNYGFAVEDGNLVIHYQDDAGQNPTYAIDANGDMTITIQ